MLADLIALLPLLALRGWKQDVDRERKQRAEELAKDRAEETPELIPVSPMIRTHPARRRTDKEMAA